MSVDPIAKTVTMYAQAGPTTPIVFDASDIACAESAVPGLTLAVESLFA